MALMVAKSCNAYVMNKSYKHSHILHLIDFILFIIQQRNRVPSIRWKGPSSVERQQNVFSPRFYPLFYQLTRSKHNVSPGIMFYWCTLLLFYYGVCFLPLHRSQKSIHTKQEGVLGCCPLGRYAKSPGPEVGETVIGKIPHSSRGSKIARNQLWWWEENIWNSALSEELQRRTKCANGNSAPFFFGETWAATQRVQPGVGCRRTVNGDITPERNGEQNFTTTSSSSERGRNNSARINRLSSVAFAPSLEDEDRRWGECFVCSWRVIVVLWEDLVMSRQIMATIAMHFRGEPHPLN